VPTDATSSREARPGSARVVARVFWIVTALFVLFILAASLLPYGSELTLVPPERRSFLALPDEAFHAHDLRDIATNVLLYLPLGLFLGVAMSGRRLRFLSPALLAGPALSLVVEIGQGFIGRTSDLIDVATNSTGHVIGLALAVIAINRLGLRPAHLIGMHDPANGADDDATARARTVAAVRFIYLCVYVVVALLPFNISVSLSSIYAQLVPDDTGTQLIIVDPLHHFRHWPSGSWGLLFAFLGLVPVGLLTALSDGLRRRFNIVGPVLVCVVAAIAVETIKLFNLSRSTDVSTVILAVLAGLAGVAGARLWLGLQHPAPTVTNVRARNGLACIVYALFLALVSWYPYSFETDIWTIVAKIRHEANWLPFRAHFSVRSLASAIDLVKETGLFVPFGLLGALFLRSARGGKERSDVARRSGATNDTARVGISRRAVYALVCGGCLAYAGLLELTQAMCIGRFVDATDPILAACGGVAGVALTRLLSTGRSTPE
jgi:glycopeptide antibiotics resistance protein